MVKKSEDRLESIHLRFQDGNLNEELRDGEKYVFSDLEMALNIENLLWKENDSVNWNLEGDRNIKFFFRMAKIKFFFTSKLTHIFNCLGFRVGTFPLSILGVPIFKGTPKASHVRPIMGKIRSKLTTWKSSLFSFVGRVQLVRSTIQSMLIHCISIYSWTISLTREIEKCIRNFIWSGDILKRKFVTVSWSKLCRPYNQCGLGLRSISTLNASSNMKLCWDILNSNEPWAMLLKSLAIKKGKHISHHISSSIWSSIKKDFDLVIQCSRVITDN